MLVVVSVIVSLGCVLASARRLWFAANPTALHPDDVVAALGDAPDRDSLARLRDRVAEDPAADWERDLLDALSVPSGEARAALVNEQLTELDHRIQRWARVPRVCASIATSAGIMLGTLVLRSALADAPEVLADVDLFLRGIIGDALAVVGFGLVGTAFCIGAYVHARRMTKERLASADRMIEKLEAAVAAPATYRVQQST